MSTILFLEATPLCREPIAAVLREKGYTTVCASDGQMGIDLLGTLTPDLVLLDFVLPKVSGTDFLRYLRSRPGGKDIPVIVLTGVATREQVLQARQLRAQEYLLKSHFSLEELLARIARHLPGKNHAAGRPEKHPVGHPGISSVSPPLQRPAPATSPARSSAADEATVTPAPNPNVQIPRLLDRDTVRKRIAAHAEAKTLAGVIAEVIQLTNSPRGSIRDLAEVLRQDAVLTTRILHVANSAAFISNKPRINTIDEAVRNIGVSTVRNLATTIGVFGAFPPDEKDGFNSVRCWQHCFAVAAILDRLPLGSAAPADGVTHVIGLCHDLGEIVLRQNFTNEYEICARLAAQSGRTMRDVQSIAFDLPYHELLAALLEKMALAPEITSPILEHAQSDFGSIGSLSPLAAALRLADVYAHGLLLASSLDASIYPFTRAACSRLFKTEVPSFDDVSLRSEVLTTTQLLARLGPSDEARLVKPLLRRRGARLWYCRQPGLASFDPIFTALQFVAEPSQRENLPASPEEFRDYKAIVLVTPRTGAAPFLTDDIEHLPRTLNLPQVPILCISPEADGTSSAHPPGFRHLQYPMNLATLDGALGEVLDSAARATQPPQRAASAAA